MSIESIWVLILALMLGKISNDTLGVMLASPVFDNPPNMRIISNLIRFPLIFISGIFVPLQEMDGIMQYVAFCSPHTYLVDPCNHAIKGVIGTKPGD